jgi:tRNA (guanine37-N1)-methyltransferase
VRIDVLTLFPEAIEPMFASSIVGRAQTAGIVSIQCTNIRNYATDRHRSVDDRPFGGGPGMVMMCGPLIDAVEDVEQKNSKTATRIMLTPQGETFTQKTAHELAERDRLLIICGHYEGFDERIREILKPREISMGDYVLSGGEPAAAVMVDAIVRLLPGAVGDEESIQDESFSHGLLEYPQYTRPREYRGLEVPDVLISGDHASIESWRRKQALERTRQRRPDLLENE